MRYQLGGLSVLSEMPLLCGLPTEADQSAAIDVSIVSVREVGAPSRCAFENRFISAGDRDFIIRPKPGLAFRLREGREISIARDHHISEQDVRAYLMGSVWAVLCHQRGTVPLHCSVVRRGGRAFAFAGASGTGKSTLAAALSKHGFTPIGDDLSVVAEVKGVPHLHALSAGLRLCLDAVEALGLMGGLAKCDDEKYLFALSERGAPKNSVELSALYVLSDGETAGIAPLRGRMRFEEVCKNVYRREWTGLIRDPVDAFAQFGSLAATLRVFRFSRPRSMAHFADGLALLERHIGAIDTGELAA